MKKKLFFLMLGFLFISSILNADSTSLFDKGEKLYNQGKYSEAIKYFEKILEENPKNQAAYYNVALCYSNLKKSKDVKEYLVKGLEIDERSEIGKKIVVLLNEIAEDEAKEKEKQEEGKLKLIPKIGETAYICTISGDNFNVKSGILVKVKKDKEGSSCAVLKKGQNLEYFLLENKIFTTEEGYKKILRGVKRYKETVENWKKEKTDNFNSFYKPESMLGGRFWIILCNEKWKLRDICTAWQPFIVYQGLINKISSEYLWMGLYKIPKWRITNVIPVKKHENRTFYSHFIAYRVRITKGADTIPYIYEGKAEMYCKYSDSPKKYLNLSIRESGYFLIHPRSDCKIRNKNASWENWINSVEEKGVDTTLVRREKGLRKIDLDEAEGWVYPGEANPGDAEILDTCEKYNLRYVNGRFYFK